MKRACYFLKHNFVEPSQLNSSSVSSEQFPLVATNLLDPYKRSKKWRSSGYFKIPETAKKIVIEESGVPITVEITMTEFQDRQAFLDHVEDEINGACSLTYALSIDVATKKTKIASSDLFSIISTDADADLCDYLGISRLVDLTGDDEYLADRVVIHTEEHFIFDLGIDAKPKALVLIGDRAKKLKLSSFAQVFIQANHFNNWETPAFTEQVKIGSRSISHVVENGIADVGYRFWKILIVDPTNQEGFVEFNKIYLGDIYSPARGAVQFPFGGDVEERSQIDESEYGERYSLDRRKRDIFTLEWHALTYQEKETVVDIFEELGRAKPLFMIYDGNAAFSSDSGFHSRFVYFDTTPKHQLTSPGTFQLSIGFKEVP